MAVVSLSGQAWAGRAAVAVLHSGPVALVRQTLQLVRQAMAPAQGVYERWRLANEPGARELRALAAQVRQFRRRPVVTLVMPVDQPELRALATTVQSVRAQLYADWELCIALDGPQPEWVARALARWARDDSRLCVTSSLCRKGLSAAACSALGLATGAWVALLDPGDTLSPEALLRLVEAMQDEDLDLVYSDEDRLDLSGRRVEPYFKPAWSPHLLMSQPYAARLAAVRRELLNRVGGIRAGFDGAHDYDLVLRVAEASGRIRHVPHVLYHRRADEPACSRGPARESAMAALDEARARRGIHGKVGSSPCAGVFRVTREAPVWPRVTIAVPTRDRADLLKACLDGLLNRTDYPDLEVLVVDHDSTDSGTLRFLSSATADPRVRVLPFTGRFNFAAMNNMAARAGRGEFVLFLNNDTETLGSGWLKAMVGLALDPSVGAVGARLLYPEGSVQHAGVVLGVGGLASHAFGKMPGSSDVYFGSLHSDRNYSAVTAACLLTRRAEFLASGGFDASELPGAYADLDYCLRLRRSGKLVVYCAEAELLHHEGASCRGAEDLAGAASFERRWRSELAFDGYYSPHLNRERADFSIRA